MGVRRWWGGVGRACAAPRRLRASIASCGSSSSLSRRQRRQKTSERTSLTNVLYSRPEMISRNSHANACIGIGKGWARVGGARVELSF